MHWARHHVRPIPGPSQGRPRTICNLPAFGAQQYLRPVFWSRFDRLPGLNLGMQFTQPEFSAGRMLSDGSNDCHYVSLWSRYASIENGGLLMLLKFASSVQLQIVLCVDD